MKNDDYEITFKPNGISIKTGVYRELIDPETNETVRVKTGSHRKALGIGNYTEAVLAARSRNGAPPVNAEQAFQDDIYELLSSHNVELRDAIIEGSVLTDHNKTLKSDNEKHDRKNKKLKQQLDHMTDAYNTSERLLEEIDNDNEVLQTANSNLQINLDHAVAVNVSLQAQLIELKETIANEKNTTPIITPTP